MEAQVLNPEALEATPIKVRRRLREISTSILRGCNVYHDETVVQLSIDFGGRANQSSSEFRENLATAFEERFVIRSKLLPEITQTEHFLQRLRSSEGAPINEVLIEAILALEIAMSAKAHTLEIIEFAEIIDTDNEKHSKLVWSSSTPMFSREIARAAIIGVNELLSDRGQTQSSGAPSSFEEVRARLMRRAGRRRMSATNLLLMQAAQRRGIPCARTSAAHLRFGEGRFQTLMRSSSTGSTSYAATRLSINKRLTNQRLQDLRLPVPRHERVSSAAKAITMAREMGLPVVIKPTKGSRGAGITVGANSEAEVTQAVAAAQAFGPDVIVEELLRGNDYRLLVIGGAFEACVTRIPPSIVGDGQRTVAELVKELNGDRARDDYRLFRIKLDDELKIHLARHGYDFGSILPPGTQLPLRSVANVTKGGIPFDVTDMVHPDNRDMAERATRAIGLDVAGIDFITMDISRSWKETGGGIIEVNARPGLDIHTWPREGRPRDVAGKVLDLIYPPQAPYRVATAAIVGGKRTTAVARELDHVLRTSGWSVGLVAHQSSYINAQPTVFDAKQKRIAPRLLLRDPEIDTLVCALSSKRLVSRGLQFTASDVAAIMPPADDQTEEVYRNSIDILLRSRPRAIVVDVRNTMALRALEAVPKERIVLVSPRGRIASAERHLRAGGRIALVGWNQGERSLRIMQPDGTFHDQPLDAALAGGSEEAPRLVTPGQPSRRVSTRLFAAALAYCLAEGGAATSRPD